MQVLCGVGFVEVLVLNYDLCVGFEVPKVGALN